MEKEIKICRYCMPENIKIENTEISVPKALAIIIFIAGAIIGIFNAVILPLNNIQVSVAAIQATLVDNKQQIADFNAQQISQNARITLIESEIKDINTKLGK